MIAMVISGGQTGVDRAALDVALELGIPCGGYCPKDREAEDGRIPDRYPLKEMIASGYPARTRANIQEADATLIIYSGPIESPGTKLTLSMCKQKGDGQQWLGINLADANDETAAFVRKWLSLHSVGTLNVAGPRESKASGIHARAVAFLRLVLAREKGG